MEKYIEIAKKQFFKYITVDNNGYVIAHKSLPQLNEDGEWKNEDGVYLYMDCDESSVSEWSNKVIEVK